MDDDGIETVLARVYLTMVVSVEVLSISLHITCTICEPYTRATPLASKWLILTEGPAFIMTI